MEPLQNGDLYYNALQGDQEERYWVSCWQVMRATSHNVWFCQVQTQKIREGPRDIRDSYYIMPIADQFFDERHIIRRHVRAGSTRDTILSCEKIYDIDGKHIRHDPVTFHRFIAGETELISKNIDPPLIDPHTLLPLD